MNVIVSGLYGVHADRGVFLKVPKWIKIKKKDPTVISFSYPDSHI